MKLCCVISFLFVTCYSFGQFRQRIGTSRPGQAIGAFTVGKNVLQFQQGLDHFSIANSKNPPSAYVSNNVIRFGILETFELSALVEYQHQEIKLDTISKTLQGISNIHFGFRVHINDQKGWIPTIGFQMRLKMPGVSKDFGIKNVAPVMVFVANWRLPKNMSLASNWSLSYSGNDPLATGKYVVNFGFPIYKNLSGFIENYGQLRKDIFQTRVDGGFAYLINNNVQLDLSAGYGNNQNIQDYFISTGISYRILNFRNDNAK